MVEAPTLDTPERITKMLMSDFLISGTESETKPIGAVSIKT